MPAGVAADGTIDAPDDALAEVRQFAPGRSLHPLLRAVRGRARRAHDPLQAAVGRTGALYVVAGLRAPTHGSIRLEGAELAGRGPAHARAAGLGFVPEERMRDGVIGDFTVADNLMLVDTRKAAYSRWGFLRSGSIRRHCRELVRAFQVKTPHLYTPARNLSGGNIQKLILARELSGQPRVLLVAQPTRRVDIGAAEYIHQRLIAQRATRTAILIVSEDLDEVLALTDRILVVYEGEIIGEVDRKDATREGLGLMMAGVRPDARHDAAM